MKPIYLYHLTQNDLVRYVGVTTNIPNRKSHHKRTKPPHTFEIIDTFADKEQAGIAEQYHIAGYKTFREGWNKSIGGEQLLSGKNHPSYIDGRSLNQKEYDQTPERKAKRLEYSRRPEVKAKRKEYLIQYQKEYRQRPELKSYMKEYRENPENKAKAKEYQKAYRARKKNENKNTCESAHNQKQ